MAKSLGSAPPGETGWPRRCSPGAGLADPSSRSKGATGSRRRLSDSANLTSIADGIGECWEVLNNAYKPYPCGVVLFPIPAVRARSSFRWITLVGGSDWALRRLARLTRLSRSLWQSRRVPDPNFNLTPRALQMTDDAPTGAVRAGKRLLAEFGFARSGRLRCDAGSSVRFRRARRTVFCLARSSRDSDHSPTVIGYLRVTGQLLPSG